MCDDLEKNQPQLDQLKIKGHTFLQQVPEEDRGELERQLGTLEELQSSVIRKALAKQEELIQYIVKQQDFETQVQSCTHVLCEVETTLQGELGLVTSLRETKERLSLCEVMSAVVV